MRMVPVFFAMQAVLAGGWALGCHRTTEQDCEKVIDKMVELELRDQGVTDPLVLDDRKKTTREKKRDDLLKTCVGKRVSQSALSCIQSARHANEITDVCLR